MFKSHSSGVDWVQMQSTCPTRSNPDLKPDATCLTHERLSIYSSTNLPTHPVGQADAAVIAVLTVSRLCISVTQQIVSILTKREAGLHSSNLKSVPEC